MFTGTLHGCPACTLDPRSILPRHEKPTNTGLRGAKVHASADAGAQLHGWGNTQTIRPERSERGHSAHYGTVTLIGIRQRLC